MTSLTYLTSLTFMTSLALPLSGFLLYLLIKIKA
jgi:hypothetical protein